METCLYAPSGFTNDSKGNPTIANENNGFLWTLTFHWIVTFDGAGMGQFTGIFTGIHPPENDTSHKPSMSGGTFSYDFTTTEITDHRFSITSKPGTPKGSIEYGPGAGQTYTVDTVLLSHLISSDGRTTMTTIPKSYVETIIASGSPDTRRTRSCIMEGTENRMD
jgi:hypothetical protein